MWGSHAPQHRLSCLSQALDSQMGVQLERALHVEVRVGMWKGNISQRPAGPVRPSGGAEGPAAGLKDCGGQESPQIPFPLLMDEDNES